MSKRLREGLGLLAVGLAGVVVSLAALGSGNESSAEQLLAIPRIVGGFLIVGGLLMVGVELLRPSHTKSSSGV